MAKKCTYCGRFRGRMGHSCPEKRRAKAGQTGGQVRPGRSSATGTDASSAATYDGAYSAYQERSSPAFPYRVYDSRDRSVGFYATEQQAQMKAMEVGGWVREYERKGDESLPERVFGDGRTITPSDGKAFDMPVKSAFDRPAKRFKALDKNGKSLGTFEDEDEARMAARDAGGKVEKYVLKPAYRYENPREHMSWWERLRDNGQAYAKAK